MKRPAWIIIALLVLVSAILLLRNNRTESSGFCLPLPDLNNFMMPKPTISLPYPAPPAPEAWSKLPPADRLANIHSRVKPLLVEEMRKQGFRLGAPTFLRGFKEDRELELWLQTSQGWERFRNYPIAALSGSLGPKLSEGDGQTPEGFYAVNSSLMNANSKYHLAMNIGYPNTWDIQHQRTGSYIMIHGGNVSIGCLAMTDPVIEELYLIVEAALAAGQSEVPVHLFPARMTNERMKAAESEAAVSFWKELQPVYEAFEATHLPPAVTVVGGVYRVQK